MRTFPLKIVLPDKTVFDGPAEALTVRTTGGDVQILAGHMDMLCAVIVGRVRLLADGREHFAACGEGFLAVSKQGVSLAVTTLEFADEIDVSRAKEAKERAEAALANAKDDRAMELAKAKLSRALCRLHVAGK